MTFQNASFPVPSLWSVVLAGGEGERTRPFVESWLGHHKPKQYCTFSGERSLFQQTVDRADALGPASLRVAVVARHHVDEATRQLRDRPRGLLLAQPANRGTAAGILFALARIRAVEPTGLVVIYPSDHFVFPEARFLGTVARAVRAAREHPESLILLGATPDGPEPDYGWIRPGSSVGSLRRVAGFVEKPLPSACEALMAEGALWNIMVVAGRLGAFWKLAARALPEATALFSLYWDAVGTPWEDEVLEHIYELLPSSDFSKDVLESARDRLLVLPLEGVLWSDWGRPERIARTLRSVGAEPAFSERHLCAVSASSAP